ncbi:MAG: TetR/AcrR family transcriptional regulator [Clostridiales Family XIII bacterium]|jgi:AcrR family transcriptional regulator|nr:TetR/AcrR family transcriptional regulator [Clostridiales Family XIII bacterium]
MSEEKLDQRVRLTRRLLKNALLTLMREQHISKISIRSLCEVAGINRGTFYSHYSDQYDLLRQLEQEVIDNLKRYLGNQSYQDNDPVSAQILTSILEYVRENAELFKALLSENCDVAFQQDIMELTHIISFSPQPEVDAKTLEYITLYGISGCITMLQKWLQDGMVKSPVEMTTLIMQVLYRGVISFE